MSCLSATLGCSELQDKSGNVDVNTLSNVKLIGIYFSAHWCPPCRSFTPQLIEAYNKVNADGKKFEIVFVSFDRSESDFSGYYDSMPWLAFPFNKQDEKEKLASTHQVKGIPHLVLLRPDSSEPLTVKGREVVTAGELSKYLE